MGRSNRFLDMFNNIEEKKLKHQDKWKVRDWKVDKTFFIDPKDADKYPSTRYSIYKHHDGTLDPVDEAGPDGYIAIFQGKKVEIPASIGGLYQAKQEAIKLLKVPKSKVGMLAVKPAYNEDHEEIDEGQHYNTRVRQVESKRGSRHIRMGVQESKKMVEGMLNKENKAPNPANKESQIKLQECNYLLERTIKRLKEVKDSKKVPQFEAVDKADLKFLMDDAVEALKALKAEGVKDADIKGLLKKAGIK